jgi:hypothetical protein
MYSTRWPSIKKLAAGLAYGLALASFYSVYVIAVVKLSPFPALERMGLTLRQVIGAYYLGGVVGGVMYGFLYPLTRFGLGTALTGYLIALPFFFHLSFQMGTSPAARPFVVLLGSLVGAFTGLWIWHDARPEPWCPTSRTIRRWWVAAFVGMPVAWYIGVVRRPSGWAVAFATILFFALAITVILVTLMRMRASAQARQRADAVRPL